MNALLRFTDLQSRRVALLPVAPNAYDFLFKAAVEDELGWPWMGLPIGPDSFQRTLWEGVLQQAVIADRRSGQLIGHVGAYNANLHHGYTYLRIHTIEGVR